MLTKSPQLQKRDTLKNKFEKPLNLCMSEYYKFVKNFLKKDQHTAENFSLLEKTVYLFLVYMWNICLTYTALIINRIDKLYYQTHF